ncbi:TlpA family protein disulfide reductase [Algoriphagus vanfongensis]|uniref:TlpA family protein disulfide reductase n=1 Tax=Algoriphagus vanfongensis TaxID=426371 RepID=UPI0012F7F51C|nr:TlpA disulfide reductase family protein [Algoriphagus vanfongensis]
MKKLLLLCLLGGVCLPISTLTAKVADPPGADLLLHRSMPHRGGDSRSDTLSIGDQIPAGIEFSEVLHYDSDKLRLDDYRGKYVFLEFWAPTCTASIASLPQLDAIQKKYGERIAILPITVFGEDQITHTISGNKRLEAVALPMVVDARKMRSYFPHSVIPHVVVLDPEGVVVAITGIEDLTETNMEQLLANGKVLFREKEDNKISLAKEEKLISGAVQLQNKNIWFQSAMTGYIPEVHGSLTQQFEEMSHIRIINLPLLYHYSLAYSEKSRHDYYSLNRVDTIGFDREELWSDKVGRDYVDWMAEGTHVFGYELIAPAHANPYRMMREDLDRYFPHINAQVEKKKWMVYALVQQEGASYPNASGSEKSYSTRNGLEMTNYPLQGFVYHLNAVFQRNSPYPFVNLTGIDYPIDLKLDANLTDVESLKQALLANGLDLILREEEINVLVLRKIAKPNLLAL